MIKIRFYHHLICYFKGHKNPYLHYLPTWVFKYKDEVIEKIHGYVCQRCFYLVIQDWQRFGDSNCFPIIKDNK